MIGDARIWRQGSWLRPQGATWVAVEPAPRIADWTRPQESDSALSALADEALSLSGGDPIATLSPRGAVILITKSWGSRCVRELVSDAPALSVLPPPPLGVVLKPHPFGAAGVQESISEVRAAIERGRNNPYVIAWARAKLAQAGLAGPRGAPLPDQIAAVLFAAQKAQVAFVKDPVNGEAMADAQYLLCLDPAGPCLPAGDCDEQLIVLGACCLAVGVPVRLCIRKYPRATQAHIMLQYDSAPRGGGPWRCLDPSSDSGICSSAPFTEEIIVDLVSPQDQTFVGLGDPLASMLGDALPDDQAAGWITDLQGVQGYLTRSAARLVQNRDALVAVRSDLGLPSYDPIPTETGYSSAAPLDSYFTTRTYTSEVAAAESKLLQTAAFVSSCIDDALSGARSLSFASGDLFIASAPGDPYSILLSTSPTGVQVPTYFDAHGSAQGTLGLPPILIGVIIAAASLAVAYVIGKICDTLASAHQEDAMGKIAKAQTDLVASGQQSPEQAQATIRAMADLNKTETPKQGALQEFLSTFPIVAIAGAALAGVVGGFGLAKATGALFRHA